MGKLCWGKQCKAPLCSVSCDSDCISVGLSLHRLERAPKILTTLSGWAEERARGRGREGEGTRARRQERI